MSYYFWKTLASSFADAVARTKEVLAANGFGVLSEIDVASTLKAKLGVDMAPYVILGACNPKFAHQAIEADPALGILLPCNVVVQAHGSGSRIWVARPEGLFEVVERDDMDGLVKAVSGRLAAVVGVMKA